MQALLEVVSDTVVDGGAVVVVVMGTEVEVEDEDTEGFSSET